MKPNTKYNNIALINRNGITLPFNINNLSGYNIVTQINNINIFLLDNNSTSTIRKTNNRIIIFKLLILFK